MGLKDDMDALGRALARGPHHAVYWRFGEAARQMLTLAEFAEAEDWHLDCMKRAFAPETRRSEQSLSGANAGQSSLMPGSLGGAVSSSSQTRPATLFPEIEDTSC